MEPVPGFVIARRPEADVTISQYPFGSQGNLRRKRNCLHEIAPQGHFLALRAQGATAPLGPRNGKPLAFTVLSAACTGRQYRAGSGMPLHYNGRCMHRERPQICGLYTVRRGRRTLQHAIDTSTTPPKMQSLFSETAFFYRPNRRKCALPARDPSAPGDRAARAGKRRRL